MVFISKIRNIRKFIRVAEINQVRLVHSWPIYVDPKIHVKHGYNWPESKLKPVVCRYYSKSKEYIKLDDDYYIAEEDSNNHLLGVTKNKFKDFNEIVFINFTEERELNRGDYLFSIEDSKTMFDFYSPLDCEIEQINHKFINKPTQDILKDLFENPEKIDNHLMKIKKRSS